MSAYKARLRFLEPFRMVEWMEDENRARHNFAWSRGQSYARWYKDKGNGGQGRPFVTGTLLRSKLLEAVEVLLERNGGKWRDYQCCPGEFYTHTKDEQEKPLHLRQRSTHSWSNREKPCTGAYPCPLCLLLGRFDKAKKRDKKGAGFHVHFGNLSLLGQPSFTGPEAIGRKRILNRVDGETGKAMDFFRVWEIDGVKEFEGEIEVNVDGQKEEAVLSLVRDSLAYVDLLCGANCCVRIESGGPKAEESPDLKKLRLLEELREVKSRERKEAQDLGKEIAKEFKSEELLKLRSLANAVRGMRPKRELALNLPKGHEEGDGKFLPHPLWDKEIGEKNGKKNDEKKKIRDILKGYATAYAYKDQVSWRFLCEELGQVLYEEVKRQEKEEPVERIRPLGDVEYFQPPDMDWQRDDALKERRTQGAFDIEYIVLGKIRALTGFFIGDDVEGRRQTSLPLLLDKEGHYRIPRSVLRGVLRRDLNYALEGRGCKAEVGPELPCSCPVCQCMRSVRLRDTISEFKAPAEIRDRIRKDALNGTVDEGALFDIEIGPEGVAFPFVLRFRGSSEGSKFPEEIRQVLKWWQDELLFLGGAAGTGKGRFVLEDLNGFCWNLRVLVYHNAYVECSYRGQENNLTILSPEALPAGLSKIDIKPIEEAAYPWEKVVWQISFEGPVLTNEPVRALLEGNSDSAFYRKAAVKQDQSGFDTLKWAIKGESIRGVARFALGRQGGDLMISHEDCDCNLCRVFGNEHEAGMVRFEDLVPVDPTVKPKRLDHVAISRLDGGAANKLKFDDEPLIGTPEHPLIFQGNFWVRRDLKSKRILADTLVEMRDGIYPIGAKGGIGYGWVHNLQLITAPGWLKDEFEHIPKLHQRESAEQAAEMEAVSPELMAQWPVQLPDLPLKDGKKSIYNPYYFLPLDRDKAPQRERLSIVGHDKFLKEGHYTGWLTCKLTTLTPLIIPDTSSDRTIAGEFPEGHKAYRFFRLNDDLVMIPGSEIRGPVSSLFEALTNSCFRVMAQKDHLSWRMKAEDAVKKFKPGQVIWSKEKGKYFIKEMDMVRIPLYDNPALAASLAAKGNDFAQLTNADTTILAFAPRNLNRFKSFSRITKGDKSDQFALAKANGVDWLAVFPDPRDPEQKSGYVKFTGPNKLELRKVPSPPPGISTLIPKDWWDIFHNEVDLRDVNIKNKFKKRNIPFFKTARQVGGDWYLYEMSKRCERLFIAKEGGGGLHLVSDKTRKLYQQILDEYKKNAERNEIPEVFRSCPPKDRILNDKDLVYFQVENWDDPESPVKYIIPVSISRIADEKPIGKHLPEAFRPCAHVCLEECDSCTAKTCLIPLYQEGMPINGLCPACHVFGSTGYGSRVRFGFAKPDRTPIWAMGGGTPLERAVTLPLQEKPRMTWVMSAKNPEIPGRKFYLHHQGWKKVIDKKDPITGKDIKANENNQTIEPLAGGNAFIFKIYFENLRNWELGLLLYCLELERDGDRKLAHKLGRGKALGFGSVEIEVQEILFRRGVGEWVKASDKIALIKSGLKWLQENDEKAWYAIPRIANLRKLLRYQGDENVEVHYPRLKKEEGDDKPGYVELKKEEPRYDAPERLKRPWDPWWEE